MQKHKLTGLHVVYMLLSIMVVIAFLYQRRSGLSVDYGVFAQILMFTVGVPSGMYGGIAGDHIGQIVCPDRFFLPKIVGVVLGAAVGVAIIKYIIDSVMSG